MQSWYLKIPYLIKEVLTVLCSFGLKLESAVWAVIINENFILFPVDSSISNEPLYYKEGPKTDLELIQSG